MPGPWEQYQQQETGPWTKYGAPSKQQVPEATISAHTPTNWERLQSGVPLLGDVANMITGRQGSRMASIPPSHADPSQGLLQPQNVYTPVEQERHPVRTGVDEFLGSLSSPTNLALMKGLGALGLAGGMAGKWLPRVASGIFAGQMGQGANETGKAAWQNWQQYKATGDEKYKNEAERLGTEAVLSGITALAAVRHAAKGTPAPRPEETTIAATGKTAPEVKAETTSSQRTGLGSEQIKARIKELETRIAAQKAVKVVAPVEPAKVMEPPKPIETQGTFFGPQAARDLPGGVDTSKYPAQQGKGVEVPGVVDATKAATKAVEAKTAPEVLPRAPEARPEPPKQPIQSKSYSGYQIVEGRKPVKERATIPEKPSSVAETERFRAMSMEEKAALQIKEFPEQADAIRKIYGLKPSGSPEVGRQAAPPEAAKPSTAPIQADQATAKGGEPVRSAETPALNEPRSLRGDLGERTPATSATAEGVARHTQAVEQARAELGVRPGEYHKDLMKRANDIELELRAKPAEAKVLNPQERLQLQRDRVVELQKKYPKVAKGRLQEMAAEQIKKEQGSLGGGAPRDPNERRADREAKINKWINYLRDPNADPMTLDSAYKMLRAYGIEGDELIRRVSGAEDFAKTGQEGDRLPEPSKEALEERIGDIPHEKMEKFFKDYLEPIPDERINMQAWAEGRRKGAEDITRVQTPLQEEVEKIGALKDPRKAEREDERGSLSFKRISEEDRKAANPLRRLADALDRIASFVEHPRLSDAEAATEQSARNIMRKAFSERDRSHAEVMKALDEAVQRHDSPVNERENFIKFMDAGEGKEGATFLNPADQSMATVLHEMFDERWEKIKDIKGLEGDGIENYLSHIWERPGKAGKVLSGLLTGRRPLEGPASFLKNRFYQYASTGMEHGLTPVTWNPIRLQLQALFDTDRFIMAHDIKDQFKDAGLTQWVKLNDYKNVPPGWAQLNDKIFRPKAMGEGALKEYGTYYAPAEVARIFNRYLEPGLGANPIFRNVRNYGNRLNMISLGVSGYHATMITLVSATSDLALGLQKVTTYGDYKGGLKDMLRGTIGTFMVRSAAMDYSLGKRIQEAAIGVHPEGILITPKIQGYIDAITKGGGGFKQDSVYTNSMSDRKGFVNWLKLGATGHPFQMLDKGVRTLSAPIMEKFVPRVKLGAAARMMEAKLAHLDKLGITDENTIATEMGKIWDSIDNRAGQMRYDNLFWNNAAKDLAFVSVRAVGWDLGSIREYGGGATIDAPRQIAKALRGERPELTHRLAFTIATPITIGLVGGMLHYYLTGKAPSKTEDYFYPGPDGAKVSFPSYMKDYFAFKENPGKTAVNKLHPTFGQMADFYHNSDFYGTEIYHPGDDKFKKGWDILKWYSKSYVPLSYKGISTRIERGESVGSAVSGYAGFMPAPSSVGQTKAENLAYDLSTREWKKGPRTSADAERFHLVQKFEHQVGLGQKINMNELTQAWQEKRIQDSDISKIYSNFNIPKLQREFKELPLPDALAVMREANPDERVQLKPFLLQKYGQLERYPLDQQQAYDREIKAYLQ